MYVLSHPCTIPPSPSHPSQVEDAPPIDLCVGVSKRRGLTLTVRDEGVGVPEDILESIFAFGFTESASAKVCMCVCARACVCACACVPVVNGSY